MPQVQLSLGDLVFAGMEVPERLAWGGEQSLVVHKLVGGARVVDAMGRDDMPLEWSGWFMGAEALDRAQYLNTQRLLGQPLTLSLDALLFTVLIQHFEASYELAYRIPYRICCVVVQDLATPTVAGAVPGVDDAMDADMATANGLGSAIGDGPLSGLLGTLNSAVSAVSTFANAAQSTINSVLQPVAAVQARVGILLASAINTTQNVATLGGVLPANPLARTVASLSQQAVAFHSQPALFNLQNVMGRMSANLSSLRGTSKPVPVAGGNLFSLAAQQYGDATSWTAIAKANGLTDPQLQGVQTLNIPTVPDTAGGVLGS